jgi:hypothetical protein
MSELEASTGDEAPPPVTSTGLSASSPRSGMILAAGRLKPQEIARLVVEESGATWVSIDGIAVWERD